MVVEVATAVLAGARTAVFAPVLGAVLPLPLLLTFTLNNRNKQE
jgi:hypothetical protein